MQTERVTFLTSREHKAALDKFAALRGESVGSVVRDATAQYLAQPEGMEREEQAAIELLVDEIEKAIPRWNARFDSMEASIGRARKSIRDALAVVEASK